MIEHVEALRTKAWKEDTNRKPSVLPDTFPWRLRLLDYPFPTKSFTSTSASDACKTFADQLSSIISTGLSTSIYHRKLGHIKRYLELDPVSQPDDLRAHKVIAKKQIRHDKKDHAHEELQTNRLVTATYLGTMAAGNVGMEDVLKVEFANHLLGLVRDDWSDVAKDVKEPVRNCVKGWRECADEEVRRFGWGCEWVFK
jgi:hypothetical protein